MSDIPPISDIHRQMALNKQERSRKREITRRPDMGEDSIFTSTNLAQLQEQVQKLMDMPDVRPEMLELGKKLASSKDFPTAESLDKLAEALLSPIDDQERYDGE